MKPYIYSEAQIRDQFGDETLNYLKNKNRGGTSSEKGNTYENFFAVYQLARLAPQVIERKESLYLSSQTLAFVDDLIIDHDDPEITLKHYQLKNSSSVSWGQELKSIADDFRKQQQINQTINRLSELCLVVSDPKLSSSLKQSQPDDLKAYSQVEHFPYAKKLTQVIAKEAKFLEAIQYLSAFEDPAPDKIECAATVLLGAWTACDKANASVLEILQKAQETSPSYIRVLSQEWEIDPDVKQILDNVANFSYNTAKGFLHWQYGGGLEEGTLPYSCITPQFKQLESLIKRQKPTSYEDLEVFLI